MAKNPKNYISYSQLISWEKGKYYEEYILGVRRESVEMDFGKKIADGLESGSNEKDVEFFRMWIPEVAEREKEITETIEGLPIKIKMDGFDEKPLKVSEYKTGKTPWTQGKVDKADQLTIYSMVVWHKYKKYPELTLIWVPTKNDGEDIALTGELPKSFQTTRSVGDYGAILKRLKTAWVGINKLYKEI
uniref:PD-(D/E)XK endonuclease-like domain-containing protein n=3 Tax=viral metagenome TaxID=1070528 RepID=A0A6H1ZFR8_9ZZZZ